MLPGVPDVPDVLGRCGLMCLTRVPDADDAVDRPMCGLAAAGTELTHTIREDSSPPLHRVVSTDRPL